MDQNRDAVRLQLLWLHQAQFAGFYAANDLGYYEQENLDVQLLPRNPAETPEEVVLKGEAEFGVDWYPSLLTAREKNPLLVNIAQLFQASSMRLVLLKDSGAQTIADLKGKRVAIIFGGNQFQILALLKRNGIDPAKDIRLASEPIENGVTLLLKKRVDAASATIYHEYQQLLDSGIKPEELIVFDVNREGTAMLEDGIFVSEQWLGASGNKDVATRFLRASLRGWEYCQSHANEAVDMVMKRNPAQGRDHQLLMLWEVNKLIWPALHAGSLGWMDPSLSRRTENLMTQFGFLKSPVIPGAYTHEIWEALASDKFIAEAG